MPEPLTPLQAGHERPNERLASNARKAALPAAVERMLSQSAEGEPSQSAEVHPNESLGSRRRKPLRKAVSLPGGQD